MDYKHLSFDFHLYTSEERKKSCLISYNDDGIGKKIYLDDLSVYDLLAYHDFLTSALSDLAFEISLRVPVSKDLYYGSKSNSRNEE